MHVIDTQIATLQKLTGMSKVINVFLSCILLLGIAINSIAQETTSDIIGTITADQKLLAGATITATHVSTGTVYSTTSRADGRYNLPNLKIGGPYTITVTFVGYKRGKAGKYFFVTWTGI